MNEEDKAQGSEEFDRFRDFVRKVVAAPKEEVDRLQAEENAAKPPRTQGRKKKAA